MPTLQTRSSMSQCQKTRADCPLNLQITYDIPSCFWQPLVEGPRFSGQWKRLWLWLSSIPRKSSTTLRAITTINNLQESHPIPHQNSWWKVKQIHYPNSPTSKKVGSSSCSQVATETFTRIHQSQSTSIRTSFRLLEPKCDGHRGWCATRHIHPRPTAAGSRSQFTWSILRGVETWKVPQVFRQRMSKFGSFGSLSFSVPGFISPGIDLYSTWAHMLIMDVSIFLISVESISGKIGWQTFLRPKAFFGLSSHMAIILGSKLPPSITSKPTQTKPRSEVKTLRTTMEAQSWRHRSIKPWGNAWLPCKMDGTCRRTTSRFDGSMSFIHLSMRSIDADDVYWDQSWSCSLAVIRGTKAVASLLPTTF